MDNEASDGVLSKLDRERLDASFEVIAAILRRHGKLNLTGGWKVTKPLLDGRTVVHKFEVKGHFKGLKK